MTDAFQILKNMPFEKYKAFWDKDRANFSDTNLFEHDNYHGASEWNLVYLKSIHPLYKMIDKDFAMHDINVTQVMYMASAARLGMDTIHTDGETNRLSAINIPIQVDLQSQFFMACNDNCIETERSSSNLPKFLYEPEKCVFYNTRTPFVFNPTKPHCFANFADSKRVVVSVTIEDTYVECIKKLPKEWF